MKRIIGFWLAVAVILGSMLVALWHIHATVARDVHREAQRQEERAR